MAGRINEIATGSCLCLELSVADLEAEPEAVEALAFRLRAAGAEAREYRPRLRRATTFQRRAPPEVSVLRCWPYSERSADARNLWVSCGPGDARSYIRTPLLMSEARIVVPPSRRSRRTPEGSRSAGAIRDWGKDAYAFRLVHHNRRRIKPPRWIIGRNVLPDVADGFRRCLPVLNRPP